MNTVELGGFPSRGTPKDRRLNRNKPKMPKVKKVKTPKPKI